MERERLLGAAAPVLEGSTSGFALDGVVHPRRDRARLAAAVAALLGCAAFAGSSLSGASVAALGDGGPAQVGVAGAPNAWGTKHNTLPWWTRPAAANARRQESLGAYKREDDETTTDEGYGETVDGETRLSANAMAATSGSPPDDSIASVSEDVVEGSTAAILTAGLGVADATATEAEAEAEDDDEVYAATEKERAARLAARATEAEAEAEDDDEVYAATEKERAARLAVRATEAEAEAEDDVEVFAATEKERAARVAARRAARAARREREEANAGLGAARRDEHERIKQGYAPLRSVVYESS
jgi:hypothetical protein